MAATLAPLNLSSVKSGSTNDPKSSSTGAFYKPQHRVSTVMSRAKVRRKRRADHKLALPVISKFDPPEEEMLKEIKTARGPTRRQLILQEVAAYKNEPSTLAERREKQRHEQLRHTMSLQLSAATARPSEARRASSSLSESSDGSKDAGGRGSSQQQKRKQFTSKRVTPKDKYDKDVADLSPRLQLLPNINDCDSSMAYVRERLELLRSSEALAADFREKARIDCQLRSEVKAEFESQIFAIEPWSAEKDAKRAVEARERRMQLIHEDAAKKRATLDAVLEKQAKAEAKREIVANMPAVARRWTVVMEAWSAAMALRAAMQRGYVQRWYRLVVIYAARHWRRLARRRKFRIHSLHFNYFIRRHLPKMVRVFKERRAVAAIPMVRQFLEQHRRVMQVSRVVTDFTLRVRAAQKMVRRRRLIKAINREAMLAAWEHENFKMMETRRVLVIFPMAFRERVIDEVLRLENERHYAARDEVFTEYVAQLERSEKLELAEQAAFLDDQTVLVREAMDTIFMVKSPFAYMKRNPLLPADPAVDGGSDNPKEIRRRLARLYIIAESQRVLAENRERDKRRRESRTASVSAPNAYLESSLSMSTLIRATESSASRAEATNAFFGNQAAERKSIKVTLPRSNPPGPTAPGRRTIVAFGEVTSPSAPAPGGGGGASHRASMVSASFLRAARHFKEITITDRRETTLKDYMSLPMFKRDHALQHIFARVRKPKWPKRRVLATSRNMQVLIELTRDALLAAYKARSGVPASPTEPAKEESGGKTGEQSPSRSPSSPAIPTEALDVMELDLSYLEKFFQLVK